MEDGETTAICVAPTPSSDKSLYRLSAFQAVAFSDSIAALESSAGVMTLDADSLFGYLYADKRHGFPTPVILFVALGSGEFR